MRILIASPYLPWPLHSGGNAAQYSTIKCLADDHQFTLVCPIYQPEGEVYARELQAQLPQVAVRAIYCASPSPRPLLPKYVNRVARGIVRRGRRLLNPRSQPPDSRPVQLYYPFDPLPEKLIAALGEELTKGVDLCQAEFAEMLPLGHWFPKHVPKLFIHHQIHFVYAKRYLDVRGRDSYSAYLESMMQAQEQNNLRSFDGVITFSDDDRRALLGCVAPEKLFTSPFPIPADIGIAAELPPSFDGRFLFVASEEHSPNRDALEWMLENIWPEIMRQLPNSRLVVIGNWRKSTKSRLMNRGIFFSGFASDLGAILRGGIMLVPLRIGSGIRVKILVALAQGVPVVTTSIGSEGMFLQDGQQLVVRDTAPDFAAGAVQLAQDPALWRRLAVGGKAAVSTHYSPERVRHRRNEIYAALTQPSRP